MSFRSIPSAHCSCSVIVPVQFSPPTEPRPPSLVNILLELAFHWRGSSPSFIISSQFQEHSSWHLYRGRQESNSILLFHLWNFISLSPLISHTQRPIHIQRRLGPHSFIHARILKKKSSPTTFTWTRPSVSAPLFFFLLHCKRRTRQQQQQQLVLLIQTLDCTNLQSPQPTPHTTIHLCPKYLLLSLLSPSNYHIYLSTYE